MSNRSKYRMTDAAAKRIHDALVAKGQEKMWLSIEHIENALRAENFYGPSNSYRYIVDLVDYLIEHQDSRLVRWIIEGYARQYYDMKGGVERLESGLQRLGIIPYPEDD